MNKASNQIWIRARGIKEQYNIALSTVYYWRQKGILKTWKKVSPRVTVYLVEEIEALFNPVSHVPKTNLTTSKPKRSRRKKLPSNNQVAPRNKVNLLDKKSPLKKTHKEKKAILFPANEENGIKKSTGDGSQRKRAIGRNTTEISQREYPQRKSVEVSPAHISQREGIKSRLMRGSKK